jgi:RNA polymerase sigma factor (sigma-70 family)
MTEPDGMSEDEFEALVLENKDDVYHYLQHKFHNSADADEYTQRTIIRAWERHCSYQPARGRFGAWLHGIAYRVWLHAIRGRAREAGLVRSLAICGPVSAPGPDELLLAAARDDAVSDMIKQLPVVNRVVLVMHLMEGMRYRAISEQVRIPESTLKKYYLKGWHLLQQIARRTVVPPRQDVA